MPLPKLRGPTNRPEPRALLAMPHSPSHRSSRWAQQQRERLREERLEAMTAAVQPIMLRVFRPTIVATIRLLSDTRHCCERQVG